MNNTEFLRKRLHDRLNISDFKKRDSVKVSGEIQKMSSSLVEIVDLAKPRLIMGGLRYGSEWEHDPLMEYMQEKFDSFKATGNFEMLVDFVNFCAIENVLKTHPQFHFNAIDR